MEIMKYIEHIIKQNGDIRQTKLSWQICSIGGPYLLDILNLLSDVISLIEYYGSKEIMNMSVSNMLDLNVLGSESSKPT